MHIQEYDSQKVQNIVDCFIEKGLLYGEGNEFTSLVTPSSTIITERELSSINQDLANLWQLYRTWNDLYQRSLSGELPGWIAEFVEYGMSEQEVSAHRLVSQAGLEPIISRVDYVSMRDSRKLAEVQWKSGGPGLFFGFQNAYAECIPATENTSTLGDVVQSFYGLMRPFCTDGSIAINDIRGRWVSGERYLQRELARLGLQYMPIDRGTLASRIVSSDGGFVLNEQDAKRIGFFYGYDFAQFSDGLLTNLARSTVNGNLWIESPLNYIYKQKWGLALPFMKQYAALFSDAVREIIAPTALVKDGQVDFTGITPYFNHPMKEKLLGVKDIMDIADIGVSLREMLVIKCGAGVGDYHNRSRGVFRICGSKGSVKKILELVKSQNIDQREPWIIQQYVDETHNLNVSLPTTLKDIEPITAHARFMIYGAMSDNGPRVIGGLGNYGHHWKVSGSAPKRDEHGRLTGTTFNDIRILKGN